MLSHQSVRSQTSPRPLTGRMPVRNGHGEHSVDRNTPTGSVVAAYRPFIQNLGVRLDPDTSAQLAPSVTINIQPPTCEQGVC